MLPKIVVEVIISDGSVFEDFGMDDMEVLPIRHGNRDDPRKILHYIKHCTLSKNCSFVSFVLKMFSPTATMLKKDLVVADVVEVIYNHLLMIAANLVVPRLVEKGETFEVIRTTIGKIAASKQPIIRRIEVHVIHKLLEELPTAVDVPDYKVSTSSIYVYVFVH
jgi:hypothetical protein